VVSEYQPALPSPAPGSPFIAIEFEGLSTTYARRSGPVL
jgi:hypothetical protein